MDPTAFQEGCSDALHDTDTTDLGRRAAVLSPALAAAGFDPAPVKAEEPKMLWLSSNGGD